MASLGEDINIAPLWDLCDGGPNCRGEGIVTAIVDDGIELDHEDLSDNILPNQSHNYTNGNRPTPTLTGMRMVPR